MCKNPLQSLKNDLSDLCDLYTEGTINDIQLLERRLKLCKTYCLNFAQLLSIENELADTDCFR